MTLTLFDIVAITIVFMSSFFGFFRGMISVVFGLLSFGIAIFISPYINPYVTDVLKEYIKDGITVKLLGYFLSFVLTYSGTAVTLSPIPSLFGSFNNSLIDKMLGIVIGFIRGFVISSILFFLLAAPIVAKIEDQRLEDSMPKWLLNSQFYQKFKPYIRLEKIKHLTREYFKENEDKKDPNNIENIFKQL